MSFLNFNYCIFCCDLQKTIMTKITILNMIAFYTKTSSEGHCSPTGQLQTMMMIKFRDAHSVYSESFCNRDTNDGATVSDLSSDQGPRLSKVHIRTLRVQQAGKSPLARHNASPYVALPIHPLYLRARDRLRQEAQDPACLMPFLSFPSPLPLIAICTVTDP